MLGFELPEHFIDTFLLFNAKLTNEDNYGDFSILVLFYVFSFLITNAPP